MCQVFKTHRINNRNGNSEIILPSTTAAIIITTLIKSPVIGIALFQTHLVHRSPLTFWGRPVSRLPLRSRVPANVFCDNFSQESYSLFFLHPATLSFPHIFVVSLASIFKLPQNQTSSWKRFTALHLVIFQRKRDSGSCLEAESHSELFHNWRLLA